MVTAYFIVGIILAIIWLIAMGATFFIGFLEDEDPDALKILSMIFAGGVVLIPIWPVWLIVALIAGFLYGIWTTARVIKHKGLDFEKANNG